MSVSFFCEIMIYWPQKYLGRGDLFFPIVHRQSCITGSTRNYSQEIKKNNLNGQQHKTNHIIYSLLCHAIPRLNNNIITYRDITYSPTLYICHMWWRKLNQVGHRNLPEEIAMNHFCHFLRIFQVEHILDCRSKTSFDHFVSKA